MNILKLKNHSKCKIGLRFFNASEVTVNLSDIKKPHTPKEQLEFGKAATDNMLQIKWNQTTGWSKPEIVPFKPLQIDPFAPVLHYGLGCFEGMKAYKTDDGRIMMFRPDQNMKRLNSSGQRLGFPAFPEEELLKLIKLLVKLEKDWIPEGRGYSLYIRPTMIGTSPSLGVRSSKDVLLFVALSPVGPYFPQGFKPIKLFADTKRVRAPLGGTGSYKLGANYAPTIQPQLEAAAHGYDQILWLRDGYVTEVGQMNLFCLWVTKDGKKQLITAPLDETILPGVTRKSVLELSREWKEYDVAEDYYTIDQLADAAKEGRIIEIFGCGTGAVVCPVAGFGYKDVYYPTPSEHVYSKKVLSALENIQYGVVSHPWGQEIRE